MWLNRSLKYGCFVIPYWPMKLYWMTKKGAKMAFMKDFPTPPEGHPDNNIRRSLLTGGRQ